MAIEEMGLAFDMALGLDASRGFGVVSKSDDDESMSHASKTLVGSKNSTGSSLMDTPVLSSSVGGLDFLDLGETRTKLYVQDEVERLEESIDGLQRRILHRLSGGAHSPAVVWK